MSCKNDHLSENLAIGALMYLQKQIIYLKNSKKQKKCLGENLETGTLVAKIPKINKKPKNKKKKNSSGENLEMNAT